jgi:DNA-binding transcriptional MocR family regulator
VVVSPGRPFFAGEPPRPFLRLTFAAEPPDRLAVAVARLRGIME